jgi:hypothetical protein
LGKDQQFPTQKEYEGPVDATPWLNCIFHLIPQTIKDAIEIVKQLGESYLWVGSLCLVQDDEEDIRDTVQKV